MSIFEMLGLMFTAWSAVLVEAWWIIPGMVGFWLFPKVWEQARRILGGGEL
jgi:hypothetical protein